MGYWKKPSEASGQWVWNQEVLGSSQTEAGAVRLSQVTPDMGAHQYLGEPRFLSSPG